SSATVCRGNTSQSRSRDQGLREAPVEVGSALLDRGPGSLAFGRGRHEFADRFSRRGSCPNSAAPIRSEPIDENQSPTRDEGQSGKPPLAARLLYGEQAHAKRWPYPCRTPPTQGGYR